MMTPAEGPATVTPPLTEREAADQMERTRGIVAGWQGLSEGPATRAHEPTCAYYGQPFKAGSGNRVCSCPGRVEGPATVTLTDDERDVLRVARKKSPNSHWIQVAVESIVAARVGALTADLAAARGQNAALIAGHMKAVRFLHQADQVIANVRALADEWERVGGFLPASQMERLRAALSAAPTGENGPPDPVKQCGICARIGHTSDEHAAPAAPTGEDK